MPFGKHRGQRLEDIPQSYLCWVLDNVANLSPTLRRQIEYALGVNQQQHTTPPPRQDLTTAIIGEWHRRLAKEFHPDLGGTHEAMKAVNRGREVLMELTRSSW